MTIADISPLLAGSDSLAAIKKPAKLAQAAQQFESLMIGEMLKTAREGDSEGWLGSGSDSSAETALGMAETQFAQAIAARGGFGLAKMIERSISHADQAAPPNTVPGGAK
jgi:Rod binding domain-containing protein